MTFCGGNARSEAAVRATLERCRSLLHERLGRRLVGLILTGSFSRGEGSVLPVNGHLRVLGDIEFLVILPHGRDYRALRPVLADWGREASAAAAAAGLVVDVEFGPEDRATWPGARARRSSCTISAGHGRVLHGSPALLQLIAAVRPRADSPPGRRPPAVQPGDRTARGVGSRGADQR